MRKDNPPIENPILNLMDKRKKKLHFRYTNTDSINYELWLEWIPWKGRITWPKTNTIHGFEIPYKEPKTNFLGSFEKSLSHDIHSNHNRLILPKKCIRTQKYTLCTEPNYGLHVIGKCSWKNRDFEKIHFGKINRNLDLCWIVFPIKSSR